MVILKVFDLKYGFPNKLINKIKSKKKIIKKWVTSTVLENVFILRLSELMMSIVRIIKKNYFGINFDLV